MVVRRVPVGALLLMLVLAAVAPALGGCGSAPDDEAWRRLNGVKKGL